MWHTARGSAVQMRDGVVDGGIFWSDNETEGGNTSAERPWEAKAEKGLPVWAQVLIGTLVTLVLLAIYSVIKARYLSMIPYGADKEQLEVVLQEAMERAQQLQEELDERRAALEEAQLHEMLGQQGEEFRAARERQREAEEAIDARTRLIHEAAAKTAQQTEALRAGATRVQDTFVEAAESSKERVEEFARKETKTVYQRLQEAVEERQANLPAWEPPAWMVADSVIRIPPLMNLIIGIIAPSQLHFTREYSANIFSLSLLMIGLSVLVYVLERNTHCEDKEVWTWHYGLLGFLVVDVLCRMYIIRQADIGMNILKSSREDLERGDQLSTGNPLFDFIDHVRRGNARFFEAFFKYRAVVDSWFYHLSQWNSFFCLCWAGFGLYLTVTHVVWDSMRCEARLALIYMHAYSFFFVVLLTWNLIFVVLWVVTLVAGSRLVSKPIMKVVMALDDRFFNGAPVITLLTQSFILKNSADALGLSADQVQQEMDELEEKSAELKLQLEERERQLEDLQELIGEASTEKEFMERCERRVAEGLEEAKPFVGLIAANVATNPQSPDPTATSSASQPPRERLAARAGRSSFASRRGSFVARQRARSRGQEGGEIGRAHV